MPLQVELVSPERTLLSTEADYVRARTVDGGDFAILSGHTPFIGALAVWTVEIKLTDKSVLLAAVHGGFIEVSNDHVKILSDLAELADQIDVARAERAAEAADVRLRNGDDDLATADLVKAQARLRAVGQLV
jgi:F-type H+-transporting ATPase subunit epsilon